MKFLSPFMPLPGRPTTKVINLLKVHSPRAAIVSCRVLGGSAVAEDMESSLEAEAKEDEDPKAL